MKQSDLSLIPANCIRVWLHHFTVLYLDNDVAAATQGIIVVVCYAEISASPAQKFIYYVPEVQFLHCWSSNIQCHFILTINHEHSWQDFSRWPSAWGCTCIPSHCASYMYVIPYVLIRCMVICGCTLPMPFPRTNQPIAYLTSPTQTNIVFTVVFKSWHANVRFSDGCSEASSKLDFKPVYTNFLCEFC